MALAPSVFRIYDPVTGFFTTIDANGLKVTVNSSVLPTGAATAAKQPALGVAGTPSNDVISVQGVAGGTPLPVSGTVGVNNFPATQAISAAALPLPTGAATSALQTSGNTTLSAISGQLPATLGQKAAAASLAVVLASDQPALPTTSASSSTATLTQPAASASNVAALASNTSRKGVVMVNDSNSIAYIAYGITATSSVWTYRLYPGATWEMPAPIYTGAINAIWEAATGNMRITELT